MTSKAKKNKFFGIYEKNFLNEPQLIRTDLEFGLAASDFVNVEIWPES